MTYIFLFCISIDARSPWNSATLALDIKWSQWGLEISKVASFCKNKFTISRYGVLWNGLFFFNLTLTDRNKQAKFGLNGVLELWDVEIFDTTTSFYWINDACHLWSNLQTSKFWGVKKEFECTECKAIFKNFFCTFLGFLLMPFCFKL